jgi:hypothetical protein
MKRFVVTTLGAAAIGLVGASSAAQAAMINFTVTALDGTPTYTGTSLDQSSAIDLDTALLLVIEVLDGDNSGLSPFDTVTLGPVKIVYGDGPGTLPGSGLTKYWTGDNGDMFAETLTAIDSISRATPDQIIVHLSGTVSDSQRLFVDTPAFFVLNATQFGGAGTVTSISFTSTAVTGAGGVPEPSTWIMAALGFGALGYAAASRRRNAV